MSEGFRVMRVLFLLLTLTASVRLGAGEPGSAAIVVYNSAMAASKEVAEHYAQRRHVPNEQVFGFELPTSETITRWDFNEKLAKPLLARLQAAGLMVFDDLQASNGWPGKLQQAKVRYAVLCYGAPLRVLEDPSVTEPRFENARPELRRNGAAVDAEITLLPSMGKYPLSGPLVNPFFAATNAEGLGPGAGVLLTARLDGPTAEVARQLVDKAMEAEADGLWGRGYFDLRGITDGPLKEGDDWIGAAAKAAHEYGFDTVVDDNPGTFSADFPMSQIALYFGWYDAYVTGPFARKQVEFMPGAFAYHLYSFSASTLRDRSPTNQPWCEAFLAKGAAATMGCVDEPYLDATPNVGVFMDRWFRGFSFGEAAFVSQRALSWQTTVIGDPLYRPFDKTPKQQHEALLARNSDLAAWSFIRIVNVGRQLGTPLQQCIDLLTHAPLLQRSAVLNEKLGDLYMDAGNWTPARRAYERALKLKPTPQQRVRLERKAKEAKK